MKNIKKNQNLHIGQPTRRRIQEPNQDPHYPSKGGLCRRFKCVLCGFPHCASQVSCFTILKTDL